MIKRKFKIALASAGITQATWAKTHNLSAPCLSKLLSGKMTSKKIMQKVNDFINTEMANLRFVRTNRKVA